jgi:hypothetical protein
MFARSQTIEGSHESDRALELGLHIMEFKDEQIASIQPAVINHSVLTPDL